MAKSENLEMRDIDRTETDDMTRLQETSFDLPDIPLEQQTTEQLSVELKNEEFVSKVRKDLKLMKEIDKTVYKNLTSDKDGYLYYKHKRISTKGGQKLGSVKNLKKSPEAREFLQKIGYETDSRIESDRDLQAVAAEQAPAETRDLETVSPEQAQVIKEKIRSFKVTEDWAKKEKEKALKQLGQTTNESDRKTLKELATYYEQLELQARRRYNEVVENQFKRVNEIINDKSRSLGERLKELFRRDGVTIGAIIVALGMTISTIVLSLLPTPSPPSPPSTNPVKKVLVKLSNWLLGLAKKALSALPGVIGSLISFLFKKAGELVLFLSEHLILLILGLLLFISEFIFLKIGNRRQTQEH